MPLSRRGFLSSLGAGSAGVLLAPMISGRGAEALFALGIPESTAPNGIANGIVRLDSNENLNGPGDRVLSAIRACFGVDNRYPRDEERAAVRAIATARGVPPDHLLLGCGSTEILRIATGAFAGPGRALVQASPTFEVMGRFAPVIGAEVRNVPVDARLRLGYAIARPETLKRMRPWLLDTNTNQPSLAAASATVADTARIAQQQRLNREARAFTLDYFRRNGYAPADCQANFVMVDIKRDVKAFRAECLKRGVSLGRPFPPLTTHLRVTVGTMPEMQRALDVIHSALA